MVMVRKRRSLCEASDMKKQKRKTLPHPQETFPLRKVRIIVNDPYATDDSSSDEEEELVFPKPRKVKRIVHEINFPSLESPRVESSESSSGIISKKAAVSSPNVLFKKFVGVRQRKWGKWSAEIRNPITKERNWVGTFDTQEEAVKAYGDKKAEFNVLVAKRVANVGTVSKNVKPDVSSSETSQCSLSSTIAPLDQDTSASTLTSVNSSDDLSKEEITPYANGVDSSKEVLFDFNFADLQIPDLGFFAEENGHDLDFDCFLKDDQLDFGLLADIHGFEDNGPSELPDFDFADVDELELADSTFGFLDQLAPLNIPCPMKSFAAS